MKRVFGGFTKPKKMFPYHKRFDIQITGANQTVTREFEIDSDVLGIEGVLLTSDKDEQLYFRGSQAIFVNGQEYFPDNYESKLLMSGINTNPNERYVKLDNAEALNGKIKVVYTDTENPTVVFAPYRVSIYVWGKKSTK